jgi:hypothetical protein
LPNRYDPDPDVREGQLLAEVARLTERLQRLEKRDSDRPSITAERTWYRELMTLVAAIVGAGGTGALVTSRTPTPQKVDNQGAAIASMKADLDEAREGLRQAQAQLRELRIIQREKTAWDIELWRSQGVMIRKPPGLPAIEPIEVVIPLRPKNRVSKGPTLEVLTSPPSP